MGKPKISMIDEDNEEDKSFNSVNFLNPDIEPTSPSKQSRDTVSVMSSHFGIIKPIK